MRSSARCKAAGYRTLTTAMDGASERIRETSSGKARVRHLVRAGRARARRTV